MKKIFFLTSLILLTGLINASVIVLNDNTIIKGKITKYDEEIIIETDAGVYNLKKEKVSKVYQNDEDYYKETVSKNKTNLEVMEEEKKIKYEFSPEMILYKKHVNIAIASLIIGNILFVGTLIAAAPVIGEIGFRYKERYGTSIFYLNEGMNNERILYVSLIGGLFAIAVTGISIDIAAIVNFSKAYKVKKGR
ncbi:MAG: hypothetical protein JXB50_12775 [Spirochaetes bacterium]|nr:hypothetical protein [Spirochaetota bacterium]